MGTFSNIEKVMGEAEEFFWYITSETLISANLYAKGPEVLDRGVQIKSIEPIGYSVPQNIVDNISKEIRDALKVHRDNGLLVDRLHEKIDVTLYMNEKEVAVLAFPSLSGEFDYLGFTSTDPMVLDWCKDLHCYYWDRGILRQNYRARIET